MILRYLTSGESHGPELLGIIDGLPAGLDLTEDIISRDLIRRQQGYGRGGRMKIESDAAKIVSGVRWGKSTGAPVGLVIQNRDWENWKERMSASPSDSGKAEPVTRPRPGHADLAGMMKYGHDDARDILERSSARETAMRVAVGAAAKALFSQFGISVLGWVVEIGGIRAEIKGRSGHSFQTGGGLRRCGVRTRARPGT